MKPGFRSWLYRLISAFAGMIGIFLALTVLEVSRFYGFPKLFQPALVALVMALLLVTIAFIGIWSWRRFGLVFLILTAVCALPYFAYRPEMFRDDVLDQLENPPLSADLLVYRGIILKADPERALKIDRLQFMYGMLRSYGVRPVKPTNISPGTK